MTPQETADANATAGIKAAQAAQAAQDEINAKAARDAAAAGVPNTPLPGDPQESAAKAAVLGGLDALDRAKAAANARAGHIPASHAARVYAQQPGMTDEVFNNRANFNLGDHLRGLRGAVAAVDAKTGAPLTADVSNRISDLEGTLKKVMERSSDIEARNAALASENAALKAKLGA